MASSRKAAASLFMLLGVSLGPGAHAAPTKAKPEAPGAKAKSKAPGTRAKPPTPGTRAKPGSQGVKNKSEMPAVKTKPEAPAAKPIPEAPAINFKPEPATMGVPASNENPTQDMGPLPKEPRGKAVSTVLNTVTEECKVQGQGRGFVAGQAIRFYWNEGDTHPKGIEGEVTDVVVDDIFFVSVPDSDNRSCAALFGQRFRGLDDAIPLKLVRSQVPRLGLDLFGAVEFGAAGGLDPLASAGTTKLPPLYGGGLEARVYPFNLSGIDAIGLDRIGVIARGRRLSSKSPLTSRSGGVSEVSQRLSLAGGVLLTLPALRNRLILEPHFLPIVYESIEFSQEKAGGAMVTPLRGLEWKSMEVGGRIRVLPFRWLSFSPGGAYAFRTRAIVTPVSEVEAARLEIWQARGLGRGTTTVPASRIANVGTLRSPRSWRAGGALTLHGGRWALRTEYGYSSLSAGMVSPLDSKETRVSATNHAIEMGIGLFL